VLLPQATIVNATAKMLTAIAAVFRFTVAERITPYRPANPYCENMCIVATFGRHHAGPG
jgi:hypothetical protein